jgi:pSer/pThr/pTyr-binding forkhead associated (FHA) protein
VVARLRPIGGSVGVAAITVPPRAFNIGRAPSNQLQLFDPRVSRAHARIEYRDGKYFLTDLDSQHGVFLNFAQIPPHQPLELHHGDTIQVSGLYALSFAVELLPQQAELPLTQTLAT